MLMHQPVYGHTYTHTRTLERVIQCKMSWSIVAKLMTISKDKFQVTLSNNLTMEAHKRISSSSLTCRKFECETDAYVLLCFMQLSFVVHPWVQDTVRGLMG